MCDDIRPKWQQVARRVQQTTAQEGGYAVVTMTVLVGPGGDPVFYIEPTIKKLGPQRNASFFMRQVIEALAQQPP